MWRVSPLFASLATATGLVLALLLAVAWDAIDAGWDDWYDSVRPVASGSVDLASRQGHDSVRVHITVTRHRACDMRRLQAYSRLDDGSLRDAYSNRVDRPTEGRSHPPGGTYDGGVWEIWPTDSAKSVAVYVRYRCGSRMSSSKIGEVSL